MPECKYRKIKFLFVTYTDKNGNLSFTNMSEGDEEKWLSDNKDVKIISRKVITYKLLNWGG